MTTPVVVKLGGDARPNYNPGAIGYIIEANDTPLCYPVVSFCNQTEIQSGSAPLAI